VSDTQDIERVGNLFTRNFPSPSAAAGLHAIEAYEALRWPEGKEPGCKG